MDTQTLIELFDDDITSFTLRDWRRRNLELYAYLEELGLIDPELISQDAHKRLMEVMLHARVGAANDPQNAGHVRAQNENVIHYALSAKVPKACLTISLEAGFIHDLNKAIGEPLRTDNFAVRDENGEIVRVMTTMAQLVGLNHLGDRTRRAIYGVTRSKHAIEFDVAERIDRCIVHHGLGSSRFIQRLVEGDNVWWGKEFVDPGSGARRLIHPEQPELTLESLIHDLADSTQQMQAGSAWFMKYPAGYWAGSGRSFAEMISEDEGEPEGVNIPMSLRTQIGVESRTCYRIVERAQNEGLITKALDQTLRAAIVDATVGSMRWIDDRGEHLEDQQGESVYHDVARALDCAPVQAYERLSKAIPGTQEGDDVEPIIWESARRVDTLRAERLAALVKASAT